MLTILQSLAAIANFQDCTGWANLAAMKNRPDRETDLTEFALDAGAIRLI
ncbi:MAG: hypothetical protein IGR92_13810 [Leptolyngbyaceae cyanobacterium T60_A2020_046]|nr:hypothetical protein [Leptolyngbyaceae cyanobacterium T60_A2020_046]